MRCGWLAQRHHLCGQLRHQRPAGGRRPGEQDAKARLASGNCSRKSSTLPVTSCTSPVCSVSTRLEIMSSPGMLPVSNFLTTAVAQIVTVAAAIPGPRPPSCPPMTYARREGQATPRGSSPRSALAWLVRAAQGPPSVPGLEGPAGRALAASSRSSLVVGTSMGGPPAPVPSSSRLPGAMRLRGTPSSFRSSSREVRALPALPIPRYPVPFSREFAFRRLIGTRPGSGNEQACRGNRNPGEEAECISASEPSSLSSSSFWSYGWCVADQALRLAGWARQTGAAGRVPPSFWSVVMGG